MAEYALSVIVVLFFLTSLPLMVIAAWRREPGALPVLKVHAAGFTAVLGLVLVASVRQAGVDPWWPHPILWLIMMPVVLAWAMEMLVLPATAYTARLRGDPPGPRLLFTRTLGALAVTIATAALAWSEVVRWRTVAAAEAIAAETPYCLLLMQRPSRDRIAFAAWSSGVPGWGALAFAHSLVLVVDRPDGRIWFAGPGARGIFVAQPAQVFARSASEIDAACRPRPDAARRAG